MSLVSLKVSDDQATLTANLNGQTAQLTAQDVDDLVRSLVEHRAQMRPVHPAEPPTDQSKVLTGDNLMWSVRAAGHLSALELAIQHPGIGWVVLTLSRAQVEDLQSSLAFSLNDLRPVRTGA